MKKSLLKHIAIIHQHIKKDAPKDELDVLTEINEISSALKQLGYKSKCIPATLNLESLKKQLVAGSYCGAFNMVESLDGYDSLQTCVPSLLETMTIPYTGSSADAIHMTTVKTLTKERLRAAGIRTPDWIRADHMSKKNIGSLLPAIIKPMRDDASKGITDLSVQKTISGASKRLRLIPEGCRQNWFIEHYVDGREFNISILTIKGKPTVLPCAEILFKDFPQGKPAIVGYNAKWDEESFEYKNTVRTFEFKKPDSSLLAELKSTALKCWNICELKGYARVDFRVDKKNHPTVLEINANPCLSSDGGFIAAANHHGLTFSQTVLHILHAAGLS
jgi:D-alanine-D-alanine ligase